MDRWKRIVVVPSLGVPRPGVKASEVKKTK